MTFAMIKHKMQCESGIAPILTHQEKLVWMFAPQGKFEKLIDRQTMSRSARAEKAKCAHLKLEGERDYDRSTGQNHFLRKGFMLRNRQRPMRR